jgi:hypothetical protein
MSTSLRGAHRWWTGLLVATTLAAASAMAVPVAHGIPDCDGDDPPPICDREPESEPRTRTEKSRPQATVAPADVPPPLGPAPSSCVFGGSAGDAPGKTQSLDGLMPEPPHPGEDSYVVAFYMLPHGAPEGKPEDALKMEVEDGAKYNLRRDEVEVGLASRVDWAKEIVAWDLCEGRVSSVYQENDNRAPRWMRLSWGWRQADTLVFRKPKVLGIWSDMYNLDFKQFWNVFGGKSVTFIWAWDGS